MISLYYIESKCYYKDSLGVDHQVSDGGDMPLLTTNKKTALDTAKMLVEFDINTYGYKIIIPNEENPARKEDCLFAVRLMKDMDEVRKEYRVYKVWTL